MLMQRCRALGPVGLLLLILVVGLLSQTVADRPAETTLPDKSRLAVLVYFDQLRGDYLERWRSLFVEQGFNRLLRDGAWFTNCHYPYANTVTGAGHASVATGCSPWKHGIILNDWYQRSEGASVYCVTDFRSEPVPPLPIEPRNREAAMKARGGTPERLLAATVADVLKSATGGKARVVSLSLKDRSAILPGGQSPDACYWYEIETGQFVTSTYYRDRVHPWVEEFNRGRPADRYYGREWQRLLPHVDYQRYSSPEEAPGKDEGFALGRTFPHLLTGGMSRPARKYYEAIYGTPFGNELLFDLVKRGIAAEALGKHATPDLLCVSFSANDPIGHVWGPDSQEVLDVTLRSDLLVKELLEVLDAQVGKGAYFLVLTADHGICPLPEHSKEEGKDAGRIKPMVLKKQMAEYLEETFGLKGDAAAAVEGFTGEGIYLSRAWLRARGQDPREVNARLARWLKNQTGILTTYTREQLIKGLPEEDVIGQCVRRSFHPDRSGDVILVPKPYWFVSPYPTGTTHGSPHSYDTHVPLVVYGQGIKPQVRPDAVTPQAAAAILAEALGVAPPKMAEAKVPENLFSSNK
jgi:predicted AlkP superfamily pyrophosphatase or phosphodiesterase